MVGLIFFDCFFKLDAGLIRDRSRSVNKASPSMLASINLT